MTRRRVAFGLVLLCSALSTHQAYAHRLDEYLQATMISVDRARVVAQLRLTPGVAVFPRVFAALDASSDGVISAAEGHAYAERVVGDLTLAVDGNRLPLHLRAVRISDVDAMKEGRGEIVIDLDAVVPPGEGNRRLSFENRHQREIGVYLVNGLVSTDSAIRITAQRRSTDQSSYVLEYAQSGTSSSSIALGARSGPWSILAVMVLLPLGWLVLLRQRRVEGTNGPTVS